MSKRNYAVIFSLILTLFCCSLTGYAAAKNGPPVSMEVSSIYGEIGKMGVHVPVSVSLYNQESEPFEGILAVQTLENGTEEGKEVYEYQYLVEIAVAETKQMELYVPLGQRSNDIHVILKKNNGETILSQTMSFDVARNTGRLLIGVLSDRAEQLAYLDEVSLNYGMVQSRMLVLDEQTIPEDAKGLELLDLLVISHYETDRLSETQIEAVKTWVENGGTLLIGTGATVYSTLGSLADGLVELPIGGIFYENVNLGTEYAERAPGDAEVNMAYADLVIPNGMVIEESDGIPLLTAVTRGSGKIGIFSYCLDEITEFVEKNPNYVASMLTTVLGEDEVSNLYYYSSYGSDEEYWNAYSLVNTGSADRLPNLGVYSLVIVAYIVLVGPGLYLFLKKKDMSRIYGTTVLASSIAVSCIVYVLGVGTRFTSQFFHVASILEIDGVHVEETSYLSVQTPDSRSLSMTVPTAYDVTALTRTSRYNEQEIEDFQPEKDGTVRIREDRQGTTVFTKKSKAFEPKFFKVTKKGDLVSQGNISGKLEWYDGKLSGTIENHFPFALEDAALILYGQMYMIGDMESGAVLNLDEEELLVWPVSMSYVAASAVIGADADEEISDSEYLEDRSRSNLYSHYLGNEFYKYTSEACLLAIGPDGGILSDSAIREQSADGVTLYAANISVSSGEEEVVYRSALKYDPEVTSGSGVIYGDGLSMYGTEPIAVEYFLGEELNVEQISFLPVSERFLEEPEYYYLKKFDGAAYFYNQTTRMYDRVDLSKVHFTVEELRPYLTQKNSVTVKYTVGESQTAGSTLLLPHLMVTGREG
ncbi:MAG: hypothetical protein E7246_00125 [Lachnoclostridium sp.]|nr:hypothetical protein [Lachnoclostridium sp.]